MLRRSPVALLVHAAPNYNRPCASDARRETALPSDLVLANLSLDLELLQLLASPNIGSKHPLYRQFDHTVGCATVQGPGEADAAVLRLVCEDKSSRKEHWLALSTDCNSRFCWLDPKEGAAMAVAEACRNLCCVGAEPIGLTDCLNFASPERPEVMAQVRDAVEGIREACVALGVPVVSGNVSFYNETNRGNDLLEALPTPLIGAVGRLESPTHRVRAGFQKPGEIVALLGPQGIGALGGSEWLTQKCGRIAGKAPRIFLQAEARLQQCLLQFARAGLLSSAHDCAEGGLAVALAECAILGGLGARLHLPWCAKPGPVELFAEDPSRVVVSLDEGHWARAELGARHCNVPLVRLGFTGGDSLTVDGALTVSVQALREAHRGALDALFGTQDFFQPQG